MADRDSRPKRLNRRRVSFLLAVILLLIVGCDDMQTQVQKVQILEQASGSYKAYRDYASLDVLYRHLRKGMERIEVENLMGEPDHSPIEGQYYYSSDQWEVENRGKEQVNVPVGMVVDYRDEQGVMTEKLQTFRLGHIGE